MDPPGTVYMCEIWSYLPMSPSIEIILMKKWNLKAWNKTIPTNIGQWILHMDRLAGQANHYHRSSFPEAGKHGADHDRGATALHHPAYTGTTSQSQDLLKRQ